MATTTANAITITHPSNIAVHIARAPAGAAARRAHRADEPAKAQIIDDIVAGGLRLDSQIDLTKPEGKRNKRARAENEVRLDVRLPPAQNAVLLLESGGVYAWQFPEQTKAGAATRRAPSTARFILGGGAASAKTRGPVTALVGAWLFAEATKTIRAYVFRFAAEAATAAIARAYEARVVKPGLVGISGYDPSRWIADGKATLPKGSAPRKILLMLHGTISSTAGSFGGLVDHAAGRSFLATAYATYDAVLGYDHSTLGQVPEQNAKDVLAALKPLPAGTALDIVAYSRGGLVARILTEQLLAGAGAQLKPQRVSFVGCTNAGTHLAEPANLRAAIDAYTNATTAGALAVAAIPGVNYAAAGASIAMQLLAGMVRLVSQAAITDAAIPGVAAMQPGSDIVQALNTAKSSVPALRYNVLTSNFVPTPESPGFNSELVSFALDEVTNRIFQAANDLVVDTSSMSDFGTRAALLAGREDYGKTSEVYHTTYFTKERVARKLATWFELSTLPDNYGRPAAGVTAEEPMADAARALAGLPMTAIVLIRRADNGPSYYLRRVREFADRWRRGGSVRDALELHEDQSAMLHPGGGSYDGVAVAPWTRVTPLATTRSIDPSGEVVATPDGTVLGVRMRPPSTGLVSRGVATFQPDLGGSGVAQPAPRAPRGGGGGEPSSPKVRRRVPIIVGQNDLERLRPSVPLPPLIEGTTLPGAAGSLGVFRTYRRHGVGASPAGGGGSGGEFGIAPRHAIFPPAGSGGSSIGLGTGAAPPQATVAEKGLPPVSCYFGARMDQYPPLRTAVAVVVTVSREALTFKIGDVAKRSPASVAVSKLTPITLAIIPQDGCKVVGDTVFQVEVPEPGTPIERAFAVRGSRDGRARILIEARQAGRMLAQFLLEPVFVDRTRPTLEARAAVTVDVEANGAAEPAVLRVYEMIRNDQVTLRYTLESRNPNISITEDQVLRSKAALKDYVASIYADIEDGMLDDASDYRSFKDALEAKGEEMAYDLLPAAIREALWKYRKSIKAIQIISDEPVIPWELLYLQDANRPVRSGFLCEWGMVRWLHNAPWPGRTIRMRQSNAFSVVPEYEGEAALAGAQREKEMLQKLFGSLTPLRVQSAAISRWLASEKVCDVLHFACHGEALERTMSDARLHLSDRPGRQPDYLTSQQVRRARFADGTAPLVFLNACQSGRPGDRLNPGVGGLIGSLIRPFAQGRGARTVVGTLWSVTDADAVPFAKAFYEGLIAGDTLVDATRRARKAAQPKGKGDMTWLAYTVYGDPFAKVAEADRVHLSTSLERQGAEP